MKKDIEFIYTSKHAFEVVDRPTPSSSFIPDWYRQLEQYHGGKLVVSGTGTNATAKKCIPLLDGMTAGYIVPLWTDVMVSKNRNNKTEINWRTSLSVFDIHQGVDQYFPAPVGYDPTVYKFHSHMRIKTPRGYSILVLPPAGHDDVPFRAIPAVIDTDGDILDISFPLWLKSGFDGIVERGTPMVNVVPFKREAWKSSFSYVTSDQNAIDYDNRINKTIKNYYRNSVWSRKDFK